MKLIANYPILYQSRQYSIGEELPASNEEMVKAWTDAGTAKWKEDEPPKAKAIPTTAQAGIAGSAVGAESETEDNLAGVVPRTTARKKK